MQTLLFPLLFFSGSLMLHTKADMLLLDVANQTFDYVIAGGGTAGLTLAARLSEDPSISVAVLEAGHENIDDPNILVPGQFGKTFGNPNYDWSFTTVEQPNSNNRTFAWRRGKGLGGTSALNFYAWSKPPAKDVDAIEKLGNPGWNWNSYLNYTKKSETFHEPTEQQRVIYPLTFDPSNRGSKGPIQTSDARLVATIDEPFQQTMLNMGLNAIDDPYGGNTTGTWIASANIDPKTTTRSYAATAYYLPNKDRPNLTVLTEATVSKVIFADRGSTRDDWTATGLEFLLNGDSSVVHVVNARKEVILSAGTIKNPQILELSGVGRKEILDVLGVDVKVELPGVGENIQEHAYLSLSFELSDEFEHQTFDLMQHPTFAAEQLRLYTQGKGLHSVGLTSFAYFPLSIACPTEASSLITTVGKDIEAQKRSGILPPGLAEQLDLQFDTLKDQSLPDLELIVYPGYFTTSPTAYAAQPGKQHVTLLMFVNHPLSRGTIHAVDKDPMQQPELDPHYFENDFDLEIFVQQIKFVRSMTKVEPWKSRVVGEVDPHPADTTDDEIRKYIKDTHSSSWHTIGSCSMLPEKDQGVVDPRLKVYGTTNLRIVDISIIPIHIAAHTQATAYVIGEKAADIIREG